MTNATYRIILGAILLISLYFNFLAVVFATVFVVLAEGITNFRIPMLVRHIRGIETLAEHKAASAGKRIEAERVFRFTVSLLLLATFPLGPDSFLWFVPWFIGFATLGAGVSGICPALLLFKWLGFR